MKDLYDICQIEERDAGKACGCMWMGDISWLTRKGEGLNGMSKERTSVAKAEAGRGRKRMAVGQGRLKRKR